jgi:hypothetical protein
LKDTKEQLAIKTEIHKNQAISDNWHQAESMRIFKNKVKAVTNQEAFKLKRE